MNPQKSDDSDNLSNDTVLLAALGNGMFSPGQDVLSSKGILVVHDLVPDIDKAIPEFRILIKGHTDGMPIRNFIQSGIECKLQFSYMRIRITADIFQAKYISSELISINGLG